MEVRMFDRKNDYQALYDLCLEHDMKIEDEEMPALGVVIENENQLIAMGFVRQCEGNVGIMDSVITNPKASSADRNKALNLLYRTVIELAKEWNISHLIGFSRDVGIIERSKKFGFMEINQTILSLQIRG